MYKKDPETGTEKNMHTTGGNVAGCSTSKGNVDENKIFSIHQVKNQPCPGLGRMHAEKCKFSFTVTGNGLSITFLENNQPIPIK